MENSYAVDVFRCEEADVYVGTSEDIPGLTLEEETLGGLFDAAMEMVPQLIEQNLDLPQDAEVQVTVRVHRPSQATAEARRQHPQPSISPKPRYVFEEDPNPSYA